MGNAFGLWALVITGGLLGAAQTGWSDVKNPHRAWPSVALVVIAVLVLGAFWMFVSGRW